MQLPIKRSVLFRNLLFLGLGFLLFYLLLRNKDWAGIRLSLMQVDYTWILYSKIFALSAVALRALRWQLMLRSLGHNPSFGSTYASLFFGNLTNMIVPQIGEFSRCYTMKVTDRIPISQMAGTIVVERATDMVLLFLTLGFAILWRFESFYGFFLGKLADIGFSPDPLFSLLAVLGIGLILIALLRIGGYWKRLMGLPKMQNLVLGMRSVLDMPEKGLYILYTGGIWIVYVLAFYITFEALEATQALVLMDSVYVYLLTNLAWLIPVQAGIGTFHWVVGTGMMSFGLAELPSLTYAFAMHAAALVWKTITGGLALSYLAIFRGLNLSDWKTMPEEK